VVGWGSLAQDLQNRVQVGQRLVLEGRLRMNTVTRQDGVKEKRAEFTLSRLHPLAGGGAPSFGAAPGASAAPATNPASAQASPGSPAPGRAGGRPPAPAPTRRQAGSAAPAPAAAVAAPAETPTWNASPLVPDFPEGEDDIPF
jgi:single-stranded DNA-binding protein